MRDILYTVGECYRVFFYRPARLPGPLNPFSHLLESPGAHFGALRPSQNTKPEGVGVYFTQRSRLFKGLETLGAIFPQHQVIRYPLCDRLCSLCGSRA
jgi:hypothetical protein